MADPAAVLRARNHVYTEGLLSHEKSKGHFCGLSKITRGANLQVKIPDQRHVSSASYMKSAAVAAV